MSEEQHPLFSVVVSGGGRNESAGFHLTVWEQTGDEEFLQRVQYDGRVKLDGDCYGPAEWVREVILGIVEGL